MKFKEERLLLSISDSTAYACSHIFLCLSIKIKTFIPFSEKYHFPEIFQLTNNNIETPIYIKQNITFNQNPPNPSSENWGLRIR